MFALALATAGQPTTATRRARPWWARSAALVQPLPATECHSGRAAAALCPPTSACCGGEADADAASCCPLQGGVCCGAAAGSCCPAGFRCAADGAACVPHVVPSTRLAEVRRPPAGGGAHAADRAADTDTVLQPLRGAPGCTGGGAAPRGSAGRQRPLDLPVERDVRAGHDVLRAAGEHRERAVLRVLQVLQRRLLPRRRGVLPEWVLL